MWIRWTSSKHNATTFLDYTLANMAGLSQLPNRMPLMSHDLYPRCGVHCAPETVEGKCPENGHMYSWSKNKCKWYFMLLFLLVFLIILWIYMIYWPILFWVASMPCGKSWLPQYHWNDLEGYRLNRLRTITTKYRPCAYFWIYTLSHWVQFITPKYTCNV